MITRQADGPPPGKRFLIGACGAAAVTMLPRYVNTLRERFGGRFTVLMTHTATEFLPSHTVALFADRVVSGNSPADPAAENQARLVAEHDLLVVLPATANTLADAATGSAPNRLAAVILAADFPVVFFPVMHRDLWRRPSVARDVARLRADGFHVNDPVRADRPAAGLRTVVRDPALPPPPRVAEVVAGLMR
ncbi:flavoprotein [Streptomyces sp. NPDC002018]|uniref:flavoprotein n=1 Tax=Streptomyces sp. NPDC002018 TaxID=3364629 RepID=UPI00367E7D20